MSAPRLCIDCRHCLMPQTVFFDAEPFAKCAVSPSFPAHVSPINGSVVPSELHWCSVARSKGGACGPSASLFEPAPPKPLPFWRRWFQ